MFIPRMGQIEQETITFRNFRIVVDLRVVRHYLLCFPIHCLCILFIGIVIFFFFFFAHLSKLVFLPCFRMA